MASTLEDYVLENDFRILKSLGCGAFGEVRLASHLPTHTQVAVKLIAKKENGLAHNIPEVEILQSLEHRNIVRFYHFIDTQKITSVVMEYVEGQDLEMFIRDIDYLKEEEARPIFQQVVRAVHFLHERLIAHRDIKLENILIDGAGNIKLCDFGLATRLTEGERLTQVCGTLVYMAPEMLAGEPYDGLAVDMWSLGVVLYVLLTGIFPYEETTCPALHRLITNTSYPTPYHLSKPCLVTIAHLLTVPSQHRITICQLLDRRWLGPIEEHEEPASKEIHLRVVETMCTIGYTCEEIVSSLRHRQPNNKVRATYNILKHKLSCEDSHHQNEKPRLISSPVRVLLPLKRRANEPSFREAGKGDFQEADMEGRRKKPKLYHDQQIRLHGTDNQMR